jgi:hypothetical protein
MNVKHNNWRIMHPALQQRVAAQPISPEMVLNNSICMALTHSLTSRYSLLFKMQKGFCLFSKIENQQNCNEYLFSVYL